jgi:ankyrin repeat protein
VDPNDLDGYAIKSTCKNGHFEVIKILLSDSRTSFSNNLIITAAEHGHADIVTLLSQHLDPSTKRNKAIRLASYHGHIDVVRELMKDKRVDPSDYNNQALTWANEKGNFQIARLLLSDTRVDINVLPEEDIEEIMK